MNAPAAPRLPQFWEEEIFEAGVLLRCAPGAETPSPILGGRDFVWEVC